MDLTISQYFAAHNMSWFRNVLVILTHLGAGALWIAIYVFLLLFFRDCCTQLIWVLILAEVVGLLAVVFLKYMTKRERPATSHKYFFLTPWNRYSFPSHHALRMFLLLVIVGTDFPEFLSILIVMAVIVSFSRICLAKHYLSDVLVGALLGIILALVSQRFLT